MDNLVERLREEALIFKNTPVGDLLDEAANTIEEQNRDIAKLLQCIEP